MAYQVKFTESTNLAKPAITVNDKTLNQQTDIGFVGKDYAGFAPVMAENLLHMLENFAKSTAPSSPVEGQLWYDNTAGYNVLKVYDGTQWNPVGSIKKSIDPPSLTASSVGDLWVDTSNSQLYMFSGSTWLLIGPQFSQGLKTGPIVEVIVDVLNTEHSIVSLYSNNIRVATVSTLAFIPKLTMPGFAKVNAGVTLTSITLSSDNIKFWGTASKADALVINGASVAATNFMRTDITTVCDAPLNIRNSSGITLGNDLSFNISVDNIVTSFNSRTSGKSIEFKVNSNSTLTSALHIDASLKVGIGNNNTNPQATLDVLGDLLVSDIINVASTTNSTAIGVGSIVTQGGLSVLMDSNLGGSLTLSKDLFINKLDSNDNPIAGPVILPSYNTSSSSPLYDIGSIDHKFRNIYADSFVGSFTGNVTGTLTGNASGSASKLESATTFRLTGDVTSTDVTFNGQTSDGTAVFLTTIGQDFITLKTEATTPMPTDQFLMYRTNSTLSGMYRITQEKLLSTVPTVPLGAILPFAGATAPAGYLLCDGSEVPISTYIKLFEVISYTYRPIELLNGANTFALPDLRGRFPLGKDNMDNHLTVTTGDGSVINAGGARNGSSASSSPANRVNQTTADVLGGSNGDDEQSISVSNLPDHTHSLANEVAQYYAGSLPESGADSNAVAGLGFPAGATGYGLPRTGKVRENALGQAISIMNPYQTINYIIYTGVL